MTQREDFIDDGIVIIIINPNISDNKQERKYVVRRIRKNIQEYIHFEYKKLLVAAFLKCLGFFPIKNEKPTSSVR